MSTVGSEQAAILIAFAEEIQPLLDTLAESVARLLARPGDAAASTVGLEQLQTLQGACLLMEFDGFGALLDQVRDAIDYLSQTPSISADQRAAGEALNALLRQEGGRLQQTEGKVAPPEAVGLLARLRSAVDPTRPITASLDLPDELHAWLDTLDGDAPPVRATAEDQTAPAPLPVGPAPAPEAAAEALRVPHAEGGVEAAEAAAPAPAPGLVAADWRGVPATDWADDELAAISLGFLDEALDPDEIAAHHTAAGAPGDAQEAAPAPAPLAIDALLDTLDAGAEPRAATAPAALPTLDIPCDVLAAITGAPPTVDEAAPPTADKPIEPAGRSNVEALAIFASERVRLVEAFAAARGALTAAPDDEEALTSLIWATHTLRGAASLVGAESISEVCALVERAMEPYTGRPTGLDAAALAFLDTAEAVLREFTGEAALARNFAIPGAADMIALLTLQLGDLDGASAEPAAAAAGWGELPAEVAARLEGVDVAELDEATLQELAALLGMASTDAPPAVAPGEPETAAPTAPAPLADLDATPPTPAPEPEAVVAADAVQDTVQGPATSGRNVPHTMAAVDAVEGAVEAAGAAAEPAPEPADAVATKFDTARSAPAPLGDTESAAALASEQVATAHTAIEPAGAAAPAKPTEATAPGAVPVQAEAIADAPYDASDAPAAAVAAAERVPDDDDAPAEERDVAMVAEATTAAAPPAEADVDVDNVQPAIEVADPAAAAPQAEPMVVAAVSPPEASLDLAPQAGADGDAEVAAPPCAPAEAGAAERGSVQSATGRDGAEPTVATTGDTLDAPARPEPAPTPLLSWPVEVAPDLIPVAEEPAAPTFDTPAAPTVPGTSEDADDAAAEIERLAAQRDSLVWAAIEPTTLLTPPADPTTILPELVEEGSAWAPPESSAELPPVGAPTDVLALDDDFEAELRAVFLAEAEEHLGTINRALLALEQALDSGPHLIEVRRAVHTLKGASAAVGLEAIADFCHVWEDALDLVVDQPGGGGSIELSLLLECAEALERYVARPDDLTAAVEFAPLVRRLVAAMPAAAPAAPADTAPLAARPAPDLAPPAPADADAPAEAGSAAPEVEPEPVAITVQPPVEPTVLGQPMAVSEEAGGPGANGEREPVPEPAALPPLWLADESTTAPTVEPAIAPPSPAPAPARPDAPAEPALPPSVAASVAQPAAAPAGAGGGEMLRMPVARVDSLISLVGEMVVQRSGLVERLERVAAGIEDLEPSLQRLRRLSADLEERFGYGNLVRLHLPARPRGATAGGPGVEWDELEFDRYGEAYQLARDLAELAADLETTRRELRQLIEDAQVATLRQGRTASGLHDELLSLRLVPISQLLPRLQRTVRQAALKSGKEIAFALDGADTLIDKTLLEEVADPLLHLLRNAVDHGIESPAERRRQGKESTGTIRIAAARDGHEVVVQVRDDGRGIDAARVIARARARGLVPADAPVDPAAARELIFAPGLSTADEVTGLSGRGIGLDAVRAQIARAKGTVTVASVPGQGTVFTIRLPALLVVAPALVVTAAGQRLALPLAQVRRVLRVDRGQIVTIGESELLPLDGEMVPVRPLDTLLGYPPGAPAAPEASLRLIVVAVGEHQLALRVDDILGQQETVVKAPAPPFDVLPGLAGVSLEGNGGVLLVVNPQELVARVDFGARALTTPSIVPVEEPVATQAAEPRHPSAPPRPGSADEVPTVLIVDDSLSVRRVVSRTLQRHGWRVLQARDGIEALEEVRNAPPHVLLVDIEMPRMDGFELAGTLKKPGPYQHLPIVILTSRGGDKHRRKAQELGVDGYLVKPYREADLLRVLREVALAAPAGAA